MIKNIEVSVNNQAIHGYIDNPGKENIVVLCHGFAANLTGPDGGIFDKLTEQLIERGFSVLRFNFRGVLPSEGHPNDLSVQSETHDLEAIIDYVKAEGYNKVVCLGESLGGTIVVNAYSHKMDVLILWYTPLNLKDTSWRSIVSEEIKQEVENQGYTISESTRIGTKLYNEILKLNIYDKGKDITAPILLLHGDQDDDVPLAQSEKFFELLPEVKKIGIINGARHGFADHQTEVIEQTLEFIQNEI